MKLIVYCKPSETKLFKMDVDFSFCLIFIRKLSFSSTESILMGTQAFASPPDMASFGVWEYIVLTKTPTFEGVCRMLYFIIFEFLPKNFLLFFVDKW